MDTAAIDALFDSLITYARDNHAEEIEEAYEYFWEEDFPEEFLSGLALDLAFINFEDWLLCDYRDKEGRGYIERYIEKTEGLSEEDGRLLSAINESMIGLYEVEKREEEGMSLRDVLSGETIPVKGGPSGGLDPGTVFAARTIRLPDGTLIGRCVYPFTADLKEEIVGHLKGQLERYRKHKRPNGSVKDFVKEESYIFNTIWVSSLYRKAKE